MTLTARFESTIAALRLTPGRAIVAVSGGVDSVVLLDLLARSAPARGLELIVGHVDHGIQPVTVPRAIVERHAARLKLPLRLRDLALGPGCSETEAREARHAALAEMADADGCGHIFLAHHADDQAETVLMRLLRGSGPAGLAAMARRRGRLVRPLLEVTREELRAHAVAERLDWWEDPANDDRRHLRSWLRSEIMPELAARLPDVVGRLGTSAAHAARDRRAWRAALQQWPQLDWHRADGVDSLDWLVLSALPGALRLALLGAFAREAGCAAGPARLAAGVRQLAAGTSGLIADLSGGWRLELAFGRLRLLPPRPSPAVTPVPLEHSTGDLDWGDWHLRWATESAPPQQERAAATAWFAPAHLTVRAWVPGDRVRPLGGTGQRLAVRCFQDARIAGTARAGWPIIESAGTVAWIPGVCRSDQLLPVPGSSSVRLEVSPRV